MKIGSVFETNRTQAVRLPVETRFPRGVKKISVRIMGRARILEPLDNTWDSFFSPADEGVTEDFMTVRSSQKQTERESFQMLNYMLDTNIAIYVIKRRPAELLEIFNTHAGHMCISSITLAELSHGVEKSTLPERNRKNVEDFVSRLEILNYDDSAAVHYGDIRADLERKGTLIGVNDLHIAGHARSRGLILVTNNTREFKRVEGLRVIDWTDKQFTTL